jgi:hypothetical protein
VTRAARRRFALRLRRQLDYLGTTYGADVPAEALAALARCGDSAFERVELALRERAWRGLRLYPLHTLNAVRAGGGSWRRTPLTVLRSFQALWGLESLGDLPREFVRRLGVRIASTTSSIAGRARGG